jgi:hypothetical protein
MAKARASNYSDFDAIPIGTKVHLRLKDEDETVEPTFRNARKVSDAAGHEGEKHADFVLPGNSYPTEISEKTYVAWTRHE